MKKEFNTDALLDELLKMRDDYSVFSEIVEEDNINYRITKQAHYEKLAETVDFIINLIRRMAGGAAE